MSEPPSPIRQEVAGISVFLGAIWAVYLISYALPGLNLYGLVPRTGKGLVGIVSMPFLHGNLRHILGNTFSLGVLLVLLAGSRARSWPVVVEIIVLGGGLLWLFGRPAIHIGASGLVSGLITFLIVAGLREARLGSIGVALLVGFLYGGSLLAGVLPRLGSDVSWDGHLAGALAGVAVAVATTLGSAPAVDPLEGL